MPFAKSFNIILEESDNESGLVVLDGTDSTGVADAGDRLIAVDASQSEAKPGWLTEAADGSGDYAKENVIAFDGGWGFQPGSAATGNGNTNADPEILVASRGLRKSIDVPTAPQVTIGNATDKTKYYPDGDTFTGAASSSLGDIVVYVRFNEQIDVTGTPQLQLKQATALGSTFGTIMDYNSGYSDLSNGIMAFALEATTDTRTSNVTNNTLGVNSDDAISLNSGTISKVAGDRIMDEEGNPMRLDATAADTDTNGLLRLEGVMAADLTMTADADASFTVS
tara:strand:+ start:839 stop:1681 length:843 start_codon:yes stop_codon:yes gene_type:complete